MWSSTTTKRREGGGGADLSEPVLSGHEDNRLPLTNVDD